MKRHKETGGVAQRDQRETEEMVISARDKVLGWGITFAKIKRNGLWREIGK